MAIKGSLREASLPDVLQLLAMGQKTGCLSVTDRNNFGYIYFDRGRISYASIVNRRDRLGDTLVKNNVITQRELDAAIDAQATQQRNKRLGEILDRAAHPHARGAAPLHPRADRRGGLLPLHLDAGDVQLRSGHASRTITTCSCRSIRSRCCSKARAAWTSGA